jgi:nitrite reductase/ring-hydroxylating ferredoxin subunit
MRSVEVAGGEILLCHTREGVFALDNVCTHAYARMSEGYLRGTRLVCPLHGGSFDVASGCALGTPAMKRLMTYSARIVDGTIEVAVEATRAP